jgi:hypothetical protein
MMLDGLTSRWTTPWPCAYASASATTATSSAASRGLARRRPAGAEQVGQGGALDEVADQVGNVVGLADLVDRNDGRVAELGDTARLAEESVQLLRAGQVARARHLDGDSAVQLRVARLVDGAEAALADRVQEQEAADPLARLERRPGRRVGLHGEARAAGGAGDLGAGGEAGDLDRVAAVRAEDVHA